MTALGLLPGLAYFLAMVSGIVFGVTKPAQLLIEILRPFAWADLAFYALVLGGSALSAMLTLGSDGICGGAKSFLRFLGWLGVLLLFVNTPMSILQLHRLLARSL